MQYTFCPENVKNVSLVFNNQSTSQKLKLNDFMHSLVPKLRSLLRHVFERVANIVLQPGADFSYLQNLQVRELIGAREPGAVLNIYMYTELNPSIK